MKFLKNRFLRNAAALQAGGFINSGFNLAASLGLAYVLGAREQGMWYVANQMYALVFLLASLGLLQVTVTQVAAASARGNTEKVCGWLAALMKGYLVLGVGIVAVGALILPEAVTLWRRVNPDVDPRLAQWAWWLLLTPLLDIPRVVVMAALQGTRRMVRMAQVENVGELLRTFLVVCGAILTGSPWGPVIGTLIGTGIASVIALGLYRHAAREEEGYALPSLRAILRHSREIPFRLAYRQGFRFGLIRMISALGVKVLPPLVVQTFSTSQWVAYLRIAQGIMQVPMMMMQGVSRTALPALAELRGTREHARFRRLFVRATFIGGGIISVGVLAVLPVIPLLDWVLPADYRQPVFLLCSILAPACVLQAFSIALDPFYLLTNQLKMLLRINVLGLVFGVTVTTVLTAQFPRTGAAWGILALTSTVLVHLGYIFWYFRHDPEQRGGAVPEGGT